jgi:Domain of unknown function (DUF4329)
MGASEQQRFVEAARNARTDGGVDTAAHMLSGLAMFDILPALGSLDHFSRDRVLGRARSVLAPGAFQRIQFAAAVVATLKIPTAPASLPHDQVEDARRYLVGRLKPANSQAGFASYSSMNAAAIQALDEVAVLTSAVGREFAGSIYKQNGAFKFTPAQMGGVDWSSSAVAIPRGTQWVAIYHTHPDVNPNAGNFSPEDIMIGRGNGKGRPPLVLYLGTPKRQIKKLTPPALLKGADAENYGLLGKPELVR